MDSGRMMLLALSIAAMLAVLLPEAVSAQEGHEGFLLRTPRVSLGIEMGYSMPDASSEIFDFTRERLTVDKGDFGSPTLGGRLGVRLTSRADLRLDLSYARSETLSEFRDWVDLDDLPIEQQTFFQRVPVTLGLQWYLRDRGRSVGRFAWIPAGWNAYVGAAAGSTFYRFEQVGDFVDFETNDIFADSFVDSGSTLTGQLFGGAEVSVHPRFVFTAEGRYSITDPVEMSGDFVGFEPMDLSGFQISLGLAARF